MAARESQKLSLVDFRFSLKQWLAIFAIIGTVLSGACAGVYKFLNFVYVPRVEYREDQAIIKEKTVKIETNVEWLVDIFKEAQRVAASRN